VEFLDTKVVVCYKGILFLERRTSDATSTGLALCTHVFAQEDRPLVQENIMKRRLGIPSCGRALALLLSCTPLVGAAWAADIYVDPTGVDPAGCVAHPNPGAPYLTIQKALSCAAAMDVIHVAAGAYSGPIIVSIPVTLEGAQVGVDACGRSATESIISGAGTLLTLISGSAGTIIDGFEFSGGARAIESATGPINDLVIRNNRIVGFTGNGVFLNDSGTDITAHQNLVDGTSKVGGGGLFHLDTDNFDGFWLTDNCIQNGATATGFFVDGNHNVGPSSARAPLISGNTITANVTGANLGSRAFEFGTISGNTFSGNGGDGLQGGIQNTAITGNTFSGNNRGLVLTSFSNTTDPTRGAQNSPITLNDFTSNVTSGLFYSAAQFAGTVSTNAANNNNFVGNGTGGTGDGVFYGGTETLNLTCNWWNHIAGPDHASNPNPPADDIAAANATFNPWLVAPAPGGTCGGPIAVEAMPWSRLKTLYR
jgi:hypothetical protein